ncbi:CopG family transcriptional regulator [Candidatus Bathyarchaeota archaeon]|nr:CopG family transcriptional regulator [Candidatus Bathyarchaeota archaeon]
MEPFTVRLTQAQKDVLRKLAKKLGVTETEVVRRAIRQFGL